MAREWTDCLSSYTDVKETEVTASLYLWLPLNTSLRDFSSLIRKIVSRIILVDPEADTLGHFICAPFDI